MAAAKLPFESVVVVPLSVTPELLNVAVIVFPAAKPVPLIESVVPATPLVGFNVIDGVTVNVADADCPPTVTWTAWPPTVLAGTANVGALPPVGIPPVPVVVVVPDNVTAEPANVAVIVWPDGKFDPDNVTVAPTFPLVGLTAIDGVAIVYEALALLIEASVATTGCTPGA